MRQLRLDSVWLPQYSQQWKGTGMTSQDQADENPASPSQEPAGQAEPDSTPPDDGEPASPSQEPASPAEPDSTPADDSDPASVPLGYHTAADDGPEANTALLTEEAEQGRTEQVEQGRTEQGEKK